jgi:hypothetical protein
MGFTPEFVCISFHKISIYLLKPRRSASEITYMQMDPVVIPCFFVGSSSTVGRPDESIHRFKMFALIMRRIFKNLGSLSRWRSDPISVRPSGSPSNRNHKICILLFLHPSFPPNCHHKFPQLHSVHSSLNHPCLKPSIYSSSKHGCSLSFPLPHPTPLSHCRRPCDPTTR